MIFTAGEIATIVEGTVDGNPDIEIHGPSRIEEGVPGTITFLSNPKYEQFVYHTDASVVLVHEDFSPVMKIKPSLIRVKDVYASLAKLFEHFGAQAEVNHHISSDAHIANSAVLDGEVTVGKFAIVSEKAEIGAGTIIHSQVFVGENTKIGKNCILFPGVKIYHNVVIGDNCIIHSNAVLGSDGFGFSKGEDGRYSKIPHLGKVILENNVEIGSNTTIDRGSIGDTIIKEGVKLDNLIQIAHNVQVGENTVIAAQSGIAGSAKVGDNCVIGGQVGIVGHIKIADGTMIQGQSGVSKTVKETGTKLHGTPALEYTRYLKSYAQFRQLPEIAKVVADLQKQIEELKKQLPPK